MPAVKPKPDPNRLIAPERREEDELEASLRPKRLAEFILTVMEGAVMQARTYRDIGCFDRNIAMLKDHFALVMREAADA